MSPLLFQINWLGEYFSGNVVSMRNIERACNLSHEMIFMLAEFIVGIGYLPQVFNDANGSYVPETENPPN